VHICYGYGIEANNKWKETLGAEWRQYEQSFPLLQQSSIDIVSLKFVAADKLIPSSKCGMAPLARGAALDKLGALSADADLVPAGLVGTAVLSAR
jgi:5-methyltetrahydropteroyltriglutamate--homocysteine methyltransferase